MFQLIMMICFSYVIGSFPTSYIVGRLLKNIDIREHGSGNVGATNTFRVIGKIPGVIVLIIDILKGFFAVHFLTQLFIVANLPFSIPFVKVMLAAAVISGHIWTIFLRFRGGKGVATGAGVLLALDPFALLIGAIVWIGFVAITHFVSLGSICACLSILIYMFFAKVPVEYIYFVSIAVAVIIIKHIPNIKRLLCKQENIV